MNAVRTGLVAVLIGALVGAALIGGAFLATKRVDVEVSSAHGELRGRIQFQQDTALHPQIKENRSVSAMSLEHRFPRYPVWKTIKLGNIQNASGFRAALKDRGMEMSPSADMGLDNVRVAATPTEVDLVRVHLHDLCKSSLAGMSEVVFVSYPIICGDAFREGLFPCPTEVGPQLRLQYPDQPEGERLFMAPRIVSRRDMNRHDAKVFFGMNDPTFVVSHPVSPQSDKPRLDYDDSTGWRVADDPELVFVRRRR